MWTFILDKDFHFKRKVTKADHRRETKNFTEREWHRRKQPTGEALVFKIEVNGHEVFSMKTKYRKDTKLRRLY